jgi:hypothetical protein
MQPAARTMKTILGNAIDFKIKLMKENKEFS